MAEQATKPTGQLPTTEWEIGKAMSAHLSPIAETTEEEAPDSGQATETDEEQEEGEEQDETEEDEEASASEPFMVLKVDGKDVAVGSKEEALPLAQKGMHYTQEMQKLRDEQRKWEVDREQADQRVRAREDQYTTALKVLHDTYGFVLGGQAPDWTSTEMLALRQNQPEEYLAKREQWDQLGAIKAEIGRIDQERQTEAQKKHQAWLKDQQTELVAKKPEWTDNTRREQDWGLIRDYGTSQGLTEQEIGNMFDHRFWMILHDAARYKQAEVVGKTKREKTESKTAAPGTGQNVNQGGRRLRQMHDQLRNTGSDRVAGDILNEVFFSKRKGR